MGGLAALRKLKNILPQSKLLDVYPGVISRGAQGGGAPLVKILDHFGGAQPP